MATPRPGTSRWNRFLKKTLNRVTLRAARSGRGPFSIVTSVGRKTGRVYETPIIVQPTDGGFMIELTYGDQVQWYKNVRAAGNCRVSYRGQEFGSRGSKR
jgi:deazaflavin-dependent oxidoreductase (nitroreductase family)